MFTMLLVGPVVYLGVLVAAALWVNFNERHGG